MSAAKSYAELSYARRLKVGAVIVREDRVVSIGYNGTPSGRDNNCEDVLFPKDPLSSTLEYKTKPEVCHAEMNAIMFAAKHGMSTEGCDLIVTHSPCFECSKMIVQSGLKKVYYEVEYRDTTAITFLKECGIIIEKVES